MDPISDSTLEWLLEDENPAVRFRAAAEAGLPGQDPLARTVWEMSAVRKMLARQNSAGVWEHTEREYGVHTSLRYLTACAEFGLRRDTRLDAAAVYAARFLEEKEDAPLNQDYSGCSDALLLRALVMLGYADLPAVGGLVERYAARQLWDGGFMCRRLLAKKPGRKGCYKATVAALLLAAECKRARRELPQTHKLVEYFLGRDVFFSSDDADKLLLDGRPGWRAIDNFFPAESMRYGLAQIMAALAALGAGSHPALEKGWRLLESKKTAAGRWTLEGTLTQQPCSFGKVGQENKWVTLYAWMAQRAI